MKLLLGFGQILRTMSHPSRGAWIEIVWKSLTHKGLRGRTPRGVRGLKWLRAAYMDKLPASHPSRGAWIEIST